MEQPSRRRRTASQTDTTLRRRLPIAAAAALLLLAAPAGAGNLVQVRVGNHPTYTRVVFEFDAPTGYRLERRAAGEAQNTIVITLQAASHARNIASKSEAVKSVSVEAVDGEAVARIVTREHDLPIKEMILTDPPRVVLDLMLPARIEALAAARPTAKPAPKPAAEQPAPARDLANRSKDPAAAGLPGDRPQPPMAANEPEPIELAPEPEAIAPPREPAIAEPEADVAESTPMVVAEPEAMVDEGEAAVVAEPTLPPLADTSEDSALVPEIAAPEPPRSLEDDPLRAELQPGTDPPRAAAPAREPAPVAKAPVAKIPSASEPDAAKSATRTGSSVFSDFDTITLGAIAGGALALLLVVFMLLRGRRALPNDMDVTALAEADPDGEDQWAPATGFSMDVPPGEAKGTAEDFESGTPAEPDDENKPIESAQAPAPGAGLFDDSLAEKDATTMQEQDMSMTQGASEAPTHLGAGSGLAGMGDVDSDVAGLVQELERRMTMMEKRLDEANEARERLERQVSAQSEELRVQRAAIARTQRALRSINRSDEDQATEPALRDPADSAGRQ